MALVFLALLLWCGGTDGGPVRTIVVTQKPVRLNVSTTSTEGPSLLVLLWNRRYKEVHNITCDGPDVPVFTDSVGVLAVPRNITSNQRDRVVTLTYEVMVKRPQRILSAELFVRLHRWFGHDSADLGQQGVTCVLRYQDGWSGLGVPDPSAPPDDPRLSFDVTHVLRNAFASPFPGKHNIIFQLEARNLKGGAPRSPKKILRLGRRGSNHAPVLDIRFPPCQSMQDESPVPMMQFLAGSQGV